MNKLLRWFTYNKVAANVLMLALLLAGFMCYSISQKEILPQINRDYVVITVKARQLTPEQAEKQLCQKVENALKNIPAIHSSQSTAQDNHCSTVVHSQFKKDREALLDAIQAALARVNFPKNTDKPIIQQSDDEVMVARLSVSGNVDYAELRQAGEQVQDELTALGLSNVILRDAKNYRVFIEIPEYQLEKHQLNLAQVAEKLQQNQKTQTAGIVQSNTAKNPIIVGKNFSGSDEIENQIIKSFSNGAQIFLKDIAAINDEFSDGSLEGRLDGKPAISISVYQERNKSITDIAEIINQYVRTAKLNNDIELDFVQDNTSFFTNRMALLKNNALYGLSLVFLILLLFLRLRVAFWVSLGIPVAFMASFIILFAFGYSINMVSSFALLLVLGIVVDDAIIVSENIHFEQSKNNDFKEAAFLGVKNIAKPVFFAVITSAISFMPLFFLPGAEGQLMSQVPVVVIACLAFSLVECLLILPSHLSHQRRKKTQKSSLQSNLQHHMDNFIQNFYQPLLKTTLRWRHGAIVGFCALLLISISLVLAGKIPVTFLTNIESEVATVHIRYQEGSPEKKVIHATRKAEQAAIRLQKELLKEFQSPQILHVRSLIDNNGISANIFINLSSGEARKISGKDLLTRLQQKTGSFPQAEKIVYKSDFSSDERSNYEIKLQSRSADNLEDATHLIKTYIDNINGSINTFDSYSINRQKIEVKLKPLAYTLGISQQDISYHIQQAFIGLTFDGIQRGAYDADIILRLPENERNSLWHLENLKIPVIDENSENMTRVPLHQVANISQGQASNNIQRLNGKRVSHIATDIDKSILKRSDLHSNVIDYFNNKIKPYYADIEISKGKSNATEEVIKTRLFYGFLGAVIFMFLTMAILFGSYGQPLMILTAVPFGIIGSIAGHVILDYSLTVWSLAGIIAVSGIVVNDNIVLVHFINETVKKGSSVSKAVLKAGTARFRPIILTTLTTFFGLIPIMFEKSFEAQFLIPMAISISFGVLFATTISLLLVPAMYLLREDIKQLLKQKITPRA